ncbi:hypothetical protein [Aquabacterium sp. CECT 9606]|uniref:hypothetical protein n=1 Tax=Aquabacterium sp. CECT 9606 TaxID=2845822 RepID=UPI001E5B15B2|nr:hypothetical protein [Aquabacterium sp. CECT 9606]
MAILDTGMVNAGLTLSKAAPAVRMNTSLIKVFDGACRIAARWLLIRVSWHISPCGESAAVLLFLNSARPHCGASRRGRGLLLAAGGLDMAHPFFLLDAI